MARADLLMNIVRAGRRGDQALFRKSVEALIAEERAKQHYVLADRLEENLRTNGSPSLEGPTFSDERMQNLLVDITPTRKLEDLLLPELVKMSCQELIEEHHRCELLRSHNLEPRSRVLLVGPPGNGKTSLAEALSEALMVPLLVVRYEGVIGSYLGETANRLRKLFDHVRTRRCVLFFDEFETLGKERGDIHETGEIKRVVSSLLLQMDALPSHVLVITASNHPELLDRAVWRRFQLRLLLPYPKGKQLTEWFRRFEKRIGEPLGYTPGYLADALAGLSFAEVEDFCTDIHRCRVLAQPQGDLKKIIHQRMKQWQARFRVPRPSRE
ncbi:ATP-binding protein [Nitrospiraceae bacterium AH_259_D15_M11_P09]|nr:ATP-binding protein [Nitrospiraceae bacterium AH_259_D15_M11_P09]